MASSASSSEIEFATYIVERIKQCGVKQVFGVPGDYNLAFLDYIENDKTLEWVGNANELNAAYAADGYARVKGGLAVIVTTFGVGELSALCGIAGSLAERLPVLHIVGAPNTEMQSGKALLHHTLNTDTSFSAFSNMSKFVSCSQALLHEINPDNTSALTEAFDKVLKDCLEQCRPGYIELPMDAIHRKVSTKSLDIKLPHPHSAPLVESAAAVSGSINSDKSINTLSSIGNDAKVLGASIDDVTSHVVEVITKMFIKAQRPIVIVDACASRFGMGGVVRDLVEKIGIRFFETPMGKSTLDEHHALYGGCYSGANSLPAVREEVESADFVLYVGSLKSDFNSGSFTINVDPRLTVELHSFTTTIGYASYPTTDIRHVLPLLIPAFMQAVTSLGGKPVHGESLKSKIESGKVDDGVEEKPDGNEIKHAWLWPRMGRWFQDNDIIITETGTSSFGLLNVPLPSHSTYVAQILWGAIGWSVGACLGCALAAQEADKTRRTVLFVGDGSLQLTVQEIGTMVRRGLAPYLFVLNNEGYEIERQIHGWTAHYNDIQSYDHQLLLPFFAGKRTKFPHQSYEVHTPEELEALLNDPAFNVPDRIRLIEVYIPRGDAPIALINQAKLTAEANSKE